MRSLLLVFVSCVISALSSPVPQSTKRYDAVVALRLSPAISYEQVRDEFGQYAVRFITAENTVVSERGRLVPTRDHGYVMEIEGKYSYIGDDGKLYVTEYIAGVDGFKVKANHLPKQVPAARIPRIK
ncbi:unnamed protein product [Danaus chrysippus]|uniref:(African queen) hypothetical protein n=1 Tax=Danaus chrysippus TaxID=151541 RepID=A0A8J2VQ31_9NEOP|nr:unnamed protein product [Danaus chrysippus]